MRDKVAKSISPELLEKDTIEDSLHLHYRVPEDLIYFEGHFDKTPVVAGVVQLKWIHDAILEHFQWTIDPAGMEAVKFHQLLLPGDTFLMTLRCDKQRSKWIFLLKSGPGKIASGRIIDKSLLADSPLELG